VKRLLPGENDPQVLAADFSTWVLAKRAVMPAASGWQLLFPQPGVSMDTHVQVANDQAKQRAAAEARLAEIRGEYHSRFREQVVALLPESTVASDPWNLDDFGKLEQEILRTANGPDRQKPLDIFNERL